MSKEANIYHETPNFIISSFPLSNPSTRLSLHMSASRFFFNLDLSNEPAPTDENHLHLYYFETYLEKFAHAFALSYINEKKANPAGYLCNPEMAAIVTRVMECGLRPEAAVLWYEAKTLELLTLALERVSEDATVTMKLSKYDTELLHIAREILVSDFENIPTIKQLARKVGTNDYKLKRGFKQLFGSSIFAYVQHLRLENARKLLVETDQPVSDIAFATGYEQVRYFAAAFKKKYGVGPLRIRQMR